MEQSGFQEAGKFAEFLSKSLAVFKENPLGYVPASLPAADPLLEAVKQMPEPTALPPQTGSYVLLNSADITLQSDGSAKEILRRAYYMVDADRVSDTGYSGVSATYNASREKCRFLAVRILDLAGKGRNVALSLAEDSLRTATRTSIWTPAAWASPSPR